MEEGGSNILTEALGLFFGLIKEMLEVGLAFLPKFISFFLWIISAILILPCVFIASNIYPKWTKWGEDF
jgi:hypothetical protein